MSKLFNWAAARLAAAFALALPLAAMAATPVAVWDGGSADYNFIQLTRGDYTLAQIGQGYSTQAAEDGSYLQIGTSNTEAAFTLKKSDGTNMGASTVIIKFENMPANGGSNRALLSFLKNGTFNNVSDIPYPFIGVAEEKNLSWASSFIWDNGIWDSASNVRTPNTFSAGQHTAALAYSYAAGAAFYVDGVLRGSSSGLRSFGYNPLGVAIGGVADSRTSNKFYAMTGMKVTAIAFFEDKISDADVASYVFPSDADKLWTATVSANTAWADIAWDGNKTWQADMSEAKVQLTIESGATVTAPASLTVDNLIVSGAGTLTFATGTNTVSASGSISAAVTLPANATLKTSGVLRFDSSSNAFAGNSLFEVVSGTAYLNAAQCGLSGDITVDAGATLVNLRSSDALNYNASPVTTVRVYGTLDFGSTRWSTRGVARNCYYFYDGAVIKGVGDGNGALDFIEGSTGGAINLEGAVTLSATIRTRDTASNIALTVAEGKTATLNLTSSVIGTGKSFSKAGSGTLKFANNPTFDAGLKVNAGALDFTGVSEVTTKVIYSAAPSSGIDYLQAPNWKGTFVADWVGANNAVFPINSYGNANSVVEVTKLAAGYVSGSNANITVVPTVKVSGTMTLDNGYSQKITTFSKLTGAGAFTNKNYTVNVTTLDNFTGSLTPLDDYGMTIGTINLSSKPAFEDKIVNLGTGANIRSLASTKVSVTNVVDDAIKLVKTSDGIYVAAASDSNGVTYVHVSDALTYAYMNHDTSLVVTVLDDTWVDDGTYDEYFVWDAVNRTYTFRQFVARVGTNYYMSLRDALNDPLVSTAMPVVMMADDHASFSADNLEVVINKAVTIDGNGFTIYGVNDKCDASKDHDIFITGSGDVAISNVTLTAFGGAATIIDGQTYPIWTGQAYTGKLTLQNVTFTGFNRTALNLNGGTVEIDGCTITGTVREGEYFQSGIEVYNANVTVANTTIASMGSTIEREDSSVAACIQLGSARADNPGTGSVTVSSGTFSGEYGIIVASNATDTVSVQGGTFSGGLLAEEGEGGGIAVSGGTFDAAVPAEYCAEGYEPTDDGEGHYTVRVDLGWIYEAEDHPNYTGGWSNSVAYAEDHKIKIEDGNTYTANRPSDGRMVTVAMTLSFDDVNDEDETVGDAKAAVKLATGGFKVYTSEGPDGAVTSVWRSVTIEGSDMIPVADQDYKFLFVLDLTNTTYTAALITSGGADTNALVLTDGSVANIPFASRGNVAPVQKIEFIGSGSVTSIEGSYEDVPVPEGFVEDEVVTLADDDTATLTAAQATWLNACGAKAAVAAKIATMDSTAFNNAYLLNLDITGEFGYEFKVTAIEVGDDDVTVTVSLTRTGALDETTKINGAVVLTGTDELGKTFETIDEAAVADDDFSEGNATTITLDKGDAKFFRPVIEIIAPKGE